MAISGDQISSVVGAYLDAFPEERARLAFFLDALDGVGPGGDVTARSVLPGHVTTGALVLDADGRLLQIAHKALGRWLNPGGHCEPGDVDLPGAALRELAEETGIASGGVVLLGSEDGVPVDVDVHAIPANDAKGEPDHWHFDFRYAFRLVGDGSVVLQEDEVDGFRWVPLSELGGTPGEKIVADKLARSVA